MSGSGFSERRSSVRLDMEKQVVSITWNDNENQSHTQKVTCLDVSRGGLKLEMAHAIEVNSIVEVQFTADDISNKSFAAKVIRCVQLEHGWYNIGLQFS